MKFATLIAAITLTVSPLANAKVDEAIISYSMYEYLVPAVAETYSWDETTTRADVISYAQCQMDIILSKATTDHEAANATVLMSEYTAYNSGFLDSVEDRDTVLTEDDLVNGYYNCLPDVV